MLRVGYFWNSHYPVAVTVSYGSQVRQALVQPGLHCLYLPVQGSAGPAIPPAAVTPTTLTGESVGGARSGEVVSHRRTVK